MTQQPSVGGVSVLEQHKVYAALRVRLTAVRLPHASVDGCLPLACTKHDNRTAAAAADVLVQTTPIYIPISHEIQMTEPLERVSLFIYLLVDNFRELSIKKFNRPSLDHTIFRYKRSINVNVMLVEKSI
jgi:hypothetical protein